MKKKFRIILKFVNLVILLISLAYIVYNEYTIFQDKELISEVQTEVVCTIEEESVNIVQKSTKETKKDEERNILPEYKKLYEENSDLYGWIKIEDTIIDYPVMHTPELEDTNFYINKNWKKEESELGSIYIDGRCKEDSENLIIYGHNRKDKSMFGSLTKYKDKEYYEQHKYIEFNTLYQKSTYEIIAVSKAVVYYDQDVPQNEYLFYEHIELNSKEEFDNYMCYMKENSYYDIENNTKYGDKLITLCTCDYWTENARLLIVAKKIDTIPHKSNNIQIKS